MQAWLWGDGEPGGGTGDDGLSLASNVDSDVSIDDVDCDGDYEIRFFRFKECLEFDSTDEEEVEDLQQEEINYVLGQPKNWKNRDVKKCVYIDDYSAACYKQWTTEWQQLTTCRMTEIFFPKPDKNKTKKILKHG